MKDKIISMEAAVKIVRFECGEFHGISGRITEKFEALPPAQPGWIPVTERLPKPNEYENNVRVYYLVQNEYGDMMVCSWHGSYWTRMYRTTKVKDKVVAWMPLPKPWGGDEK